MMFHTYVDWTLEAVPRPFYVGKGTVHRVQLRVRNKHHANVAKKYGVRRKIVFTSENEQAALDCEIQLIAEHHTFVNDPLYNGVGCNYTHGGEGTSGHKHSDDAKRRMSRLGFRHSDESRTRMSAIRKGIAPKAACKANTGRKRKPFTDEHKTRLRVARHQRTPDSPVTRARKSEAQCKRWKYT